MFCHMRSPIKLSKKIIEREIHVREKLENRTANVQFSWCSTNTSKACFALTFVINYLAND